MSTKPSLSMAGAYVLSPLVCVGFIWSWLVVYDALHANWSFTRDLLLVPWLLIFGGPICVAVELLIVTPILLGYSRYRWRWLNGWSGSLIGLLVGVCVFLLLFHRYVSDPDPRSHEALIGTIQFGVAGMLGSLPFLLSQQVGQSSK